MTLHPQSQAFLDSVAGSPAWYELEVGDARRSFDALPFFGEPPAVAHVIDESIAGVPCRIYRPTATSGLDIIIYFHGGGWVLGSIESHDVLCRHIAAQSGAAVVSVDYRRAPEDKFPAALEDCFTVCDVMSMDHQAYGLSNKIVVAGDSAGGNLATAVSLMARQRGGPKLAGQMLIYPVLDAAMNTATYEDYAEGFGLTSDTMKWFWDSYTGDKGSAARSNPMASPSREEDLSELPPAHVLIAEYDVLRTECEIYAARLAAAGVPTTTKQFDGMLHGFVHFSQPFDDADTAIQHISQECRRLLDGS